MERAGNNVCGFGGCGGSHGAEEDIGYVGVQVGYGRCTKANQVGRIREMCMCSADQTFCKDVKRHFFSYIGIILLAWFYYPCSMP